ncbi:MAG: leucyl aminopeptidase [Alicyclobacillaceae bacterium]|nr:leucyl aminopeptidase [Alicyclobacillaceae bacterium]
MEWEIVAETRFSCHLVLLTSEAAKERPFGLPLEERHGKKEELTSFLFERGGDIERWIVAGLGPQDQVRSEHLRRACGEAGRTALKDGREEVAVHVLGPSLSPETIAQSIVEGLVLGTYVFDRYKSKKHEYRLKRVDVVVPEGDRSPYRAGIERGVAHAAGTCLARDLANEPSNRLRPDTLADHVQRHFAGTPVSVEVYGGADLERMRLRGLQAVGKGSLYSPRMIEMRYQAAPEKPLIALIGKGMTFDSGGISLKTQRDISDMRMDMAGAAAVIGALDVIARLGLPVNVIGLVPAAENMPGGHSMLPGEIIEYANGTTVQVANTDAEGRLILADALILAGQRGAQTAVDIATLTGACAAALGGKVAGVFGDDRLTHVLKEIGDEVGDRVWPLPLVDDYETMLKSEYADVKNISEGPYGGAITAALFLRRFVPEGVRWAHIDMAGPMDTSSTKGYWVAGATGFGVRLLARFVEEWPGS